MKVLVVLALVLVNYATGGLITHHAGDEEHAKATSYQNINIEHYHAVPTYVKKEDSHLLHHPVSLGKSTADVKVHHGNKHDPGHAIANSHTDLHAKSDEHSEAQQVHSYGNNAHHYKTEEVAAPVAAAAPEEHEHHGYAVAAAPAQEESEHESYQPQHYSYHELAGVAGGAEDSGHGGHQGQQEASEDAGHGGYEAVAQGGHEGHGHYHVQADEQQQQQHMYQHGGYSGQHSGAGLGQYH